MVYLVTILITLLLCFLELSFLHYFLIFGATAFITLAFIVALSLRTDGYIQILVAFLAGVIFDFAGTGNIGEFTIIFLLTVLIGRVVFYRKTSYASISSFVVLLLISTLLIYAWQIPLLSSDNFVGWQSFAKTFISGLVLTLAAGVIIYKIFGSYFNWYQKKTEKY